MSATVWRTAELLSGRARHHAEAANERAYDELNRKMCSRGTDGLSDIDKLMRGGGGTNGHHKPSS